MQIYGPSHVHGSQPVKGPHAARSASGPGRTQGADEVNISAAGEAAAQAAEGGVRADLVARVREQIAAGTYESAEKLDAAVERLLDAIG
jgi:negative regulator of flagellin synthesis FlgM